MKLKMLSGLIGSGKTTLARQRVRENGNHARVNRDDLRAMLFNSEWTGKREAAVIDCEKAIAGVLLKHGLVPVIDDTNISKSHRDLWAGFAKEQGAAFEVQKLDTPIEECVWRDSLREKPIGKAIIHHMALRAGLIPWGERKICIVDIDGTLSDGKHREHFVEGEGKKDWKTYYSLLHLDTPIDLVVRWVRELKEEYTICIVSGRPDTYQFETLRWLDQHQIPYDYIFMRPGNQKNPDTEVKQAILDLMPKEKIHQVIDDRPSVVRMWKANNLRVIPVRGQCEEF